MKRLLAYLLILSVLGGCGSDEEAPNNKKTGQKVDPGTPTKETYFPLAKRGEEETFSSKREMTVQELKDFYQANAAQMDVYPIGLTHDFIREGTTYEIREEGKKYICHTESKGTQTIVAVDQINKLIKVYHQETAKYLNQKCQELGDKKSEYVQAVPLDSFRKEIDGLIKNIDQLKNIKIEAGTYQNQEAIKILGEIDNGGKNTDIVAIYRTAPSLFLYENLTLLRYKEDLLDRRHSKGVRMVDPATLNWENLPQVGSDG